MSWPERPVSELCEFAVDCVNKTAPTVDYETPYEMIRTTNVKSGFIYLDEVRHVTEDVFEKWTRRSAPQFGDVILTREAPVGEVGRCTFTDRNIFLGQRLFHYRPKPDVLNWNYLAYALQSWEVQGKLRGMGLGATVHHIKVGDAENLTIPCPPIRVQEQIGDALAAYDDLIENNRRRIALLEEAARLLYREWFVHFRFPGHEHAKLINGLPEGWQRVPASQAFAVNPKMPKRDEPTIRYVPMAALSETGMLINRAATEVRESASGARFQNGDTLLARITPCLENGKTGFVQLLDESEVACGSTEFIVLRGALVSNYFVYLASRQDDFRDNAIHSMIGSSGRQRVQASCFDRYMIAVPPSNLAALFEESVQSLFEQIGNLDQQNQKLAQARDLLLPRLMNGRIVV